MEVVDPDVVPTTPGMAAPATPDILQPHEIPEFLGMPTIHDRPLDHQMAHPTPILREERDFEAEEMFGREVENQPGDDDMQIDALERAMRLIGMSVEEEDRAVLELISRSVGNEPK